MQNNQVPDVRTRLSFGGNSGCAKDQNFDYLHHTYLLFLRELGCVKTLLHHENFLLTNEIFFISKIYAKWQIRPKS